MDKSEAQDDLFEIWDYIAIDSVRIANRIEEEFYELFESLARLPGQGHSRTDLTKHPVLFFPMYSFLVIYQPGTKAESDLALSLRKHCLTTNQHASMGLKSGE